MKLNKYIISGIIILIIISTFIIRKNLSQINLKQSNIQKTEVVDLDLQLKGINTKDINLREDLKGKLIFINFWGTWCPYCVKEMPSLQQLYNRTKANTNIAFIFIAMRDNTNKVKDFINQHNYSFPVYEAKGLIDDQLNPKVFPTTFIIDSTGKIILKEEGARDWSNFEF